MRNAKNEEALRKAVKEVYENDFESLDFYKDIRYVDVDLSKYPIKKKPNHMKYFAIAASLLIFVLLSGAFGIIISNGSVSASRFRIEQQITTIKNSMNNSSEYTVGDNYILFEIDDLSKMDKAKEFYSDLFIPKNVPERFQFNSLKVKKLSDELYQAVYLYSSENEGVLSIFQEIIPKDGSYSVSVINVTKEIEKEDGTIYISENPFGDGSNTASYITEESLIDICGTVTIDEILKIY